MKILLIDDEPLARDELRFLLNKAATGLQINEAQSIDEALSQLLVWEPEIVFLDIHLTNESGLTLADKIKAMPQPPLVIFATAFDDYAIKAFELDVQDYLLKPFEFDRVEQVVKKAIRVVKNKNVKQEKEIVEKEKDLSRLPLKTTERIYLIHTNDIIVISVANGVTEVVTVEKRYEIYEPLSTLVEKLSVKQFLRVHRSYVINLLEISEIQHWFNQTYLVTMSNGDKVPISRSYLPVFKKRVGIN